MYAYSRDSSEKDFVLAQVLRVAKTVGTIGLVGKDRGLRKRSLLAPVAYMHCAEVTLVDPTDITDILNRIFEEKLQ